MLKYTFLQWIMFFYIYCLIGWALESTLVSVSEKKFVNRGFLRIPFLPLYGFGALTILFATLPVKSDPVIAYICGALSCTLLEYVTGVVMESLFKVKYWDYSESEFNLNGKICVMSSLFWGFLSLLLTYKLHELTEKLVLNFSHTATLVIVISISVIFVSDVVYSVKTAFDVRKVLAKLTEIKNEIENLISQSVEKSERAQAIKDKIQSLNAERQKVFSKLSFYPRQLLKAHPHATSSRFSEALKDVKESIVNRRKNKTEE